MKPLKCQNCGAPLSPGARKCDFCECMIAGACSDDSSDIYAGGEQKDETPAYSNTAVSPEEFTAAPAPPHIPPQQKSSSWFKSVIYGIVLVITIAVVMNIFIEHSSSKIAQAPTAKTELSARMWTENDPMLMKGQYDEAIKERSKDIDFLGPNHSSTYVNYSKRGIAYYHKGLYKMALEDLNKAMNLTGSGWDAKQRAINCYWRGMTNEKLGNKDQALSDMREAAQRGVKEARDYLGSK
jgi:tetratricopeptide (TPR) repeat protein